jgi:hypothetical protein
MLRSNQIISALGRLARRWAPMKPFLQLLLIAALLSLAPFAPLLAADEEVVQLAELEALGYTRSDPLSIEEIERESLEELKSGAPRVPQVPFGFANEDWEEFKLQYQPGDTILRVRSPPKSWQSLAGWEGLILVRDGTIIASIAERVS